MVGALHIHSLHLAVECRRVTGDSHLTCSRSAGYACLTVARCPRTTSPHFVLPHPLFNHSYFEMNFIESICKIEHVGKCVTLLLLLLLFSGKFVLIIPESSAFCIPYKFAFCDFLRDLKVIEFWPI